MGDYFVYLLIFALFLFLSIQEAVYYFRYKSKNCLYRFIGAFGLLITSSLLNFDLIDLSFVGGAVAQITLFLLIIVIFIIFLYYDNIQKLLNHRKNARKRVMSRNPVENSLLYYCLAKHKPDKLDYYNKLCVEPLDDAAINEILDAINTEMTLSGTGQDNKPNEHGLRLKSLTDDINESHDFILNPQDK